MVYAVIVCSYEPNIFWNDGPFSTIIGCLLCLIIYFLIKLYSECYELQSKSIKYMINPENITDLGVLIIIALTI